MDWFVLIFGEMGLVQWKWCLLLWPGHGQNPCCSSMPLNMLHMFSSWTSWSTFRHWRSGLGDELWSSWVILVGLMDVEKRSLVLSWELETGLVATVVIEMSKLASWPFSLALLQEPWSVSFFGLTSVEFDSVLLLRAISCWNQTVRILYIWRS